MKKALTTLFFATIAFMSPLTAGEEDKSDENTQTEANTDAAAEAQADQREVADLVCESLMERAQGP